MLWARCRTYSSHFWCSLAGLFLRDVQRGVVPRRPDRKRGCSKGVHVVAMTTTCPSAAADQRRAVEVRAPVMQVEGRRPPLRFPEALEARPLPHLPLKRPARSPVAHQVAQRQARRESRRNVAEQCRRPERPSPKRKECARQKGPCAAEQNELKRKRPGKRSPRRKFSVSRISTFTNRFVPARRTRSGSGSRISLDPKARKARSEPRSQRERSGSRRA